MTHPTLSDLANTRTSAAPERRVTPAAGWLAVGITAVILCLYTYWFAVADRYYVFLYNHMGAQPFDATTQGRYWMTGLVAGGLIAVGYGLFNWYAARLAGLRQRYYLPPAWPRLWAWCAVPVGVGLLVITTTCNSPVLPLANAAQCVLALELSLGLALYLATLAAHALKQLVMVLGAGLGLTPALLLLRAVELPGRGVSLPANAYVLVVGGILGGGVWLLVSRAVARRLRHRLSAAEILAGGAGWSYLLLPLTHYFLFTPPRYRYISAASNFFAYDLRVQAAAFVLAVTLAWLATRLTLGGRHA